MPRFDSENFTPPRFVEKWVATHLNKLEKKALANLEFTSFKTLDLVPEIKEELVIISKKKERKKISISTELSILIQGFGNGVVYFHIVEKETKAVQCVVYADITNDVCVDLTKADEDITFFAGKNLTTTEESRNRWVSFGSEINLAPNPITSYNSLDQVEFELLNLLSPAHEIGHVINRKLSFLPRLLNGLKTWQDDRHALRAELYKLRLHIEPINESMATAEEMKEFVANYTQDKRGSSDERFSMHFALMFIKYCSENNLDLLRDISVLDFLKFLNNTLHGSNLVSQIMSKH